MRIARQRVTRLGERFGGGRLDSATMNTMLLLLASLSVCLAGCSVAAEDAPESGEHPSTGGFYALGAKDIDGQARELSQYAGKVTLVVNTASECGYTPQYAGLQKLHEELAPRGLVVLGFPSNDFGGQEPGSAEQIKSFCTSEYALSFPLYSKVVTKAGAEQSPIYAHLGAATGHLPSWNFCKYLVGRDGAVTGFYPSKVAPDDPELRKAIEAALAAR